MEDIVEFKTKGGYKYGEAMEILRAPITQPLRTVRAGRITLDSIASGSSVVRLMNEIAHPAFPIPARNLYPRTGVKL